MINRSEMIVSKAEKGEDGVLEFVASTNSVDRQGDIVEQNFDTKAFKKNPVFLWGHDGGQLPIGKIMRIWSQPVDKASSSSRETRIQVKFVPADILPFAGQVKDLYEEGFLKAVSIGFRPLERAAVTEDEREKLGLGPWGERFTKSELLEVSAVTVPANSEAVQTGVSKGLFTEDVASKINNGDILLSSQERGDLEKALDAIEVEIEAEAEEPKEEVQAESQDNEQIKGLLEAVERLVETVGLLVAHHKEDSPPAPITEDNSVEETVEEEAPEDDSEGSDAEIRDIMNGITDISEQIEEVTP